MFVHQDKQRTFNFLASLINGNHVKLVGSLSEQSTFNFLASLINGNRFLRVFPGYRMLGIF